MQHPPAASQLPHGCADALTPNLNALSCRDSTTKHTEGRPNHYREGLEARSSEPSCDSICCGKSCAVVSRLSVKSCWCSQRSPGANADALTPHFSNQQGRGEVQSLRELGASLERVLCVVCCVFCVWCVSAMTRRDSFDEQQDSLFFLDRCQI